MMSSVNPPSGKLSYFQVGSSVSRNSHTRPSVLFNSNRTKRKFPQIKSASMPVTSAPLVYSPPPSMSGSFEVDEKPGEARIDEWMESSVNDIVQNLKQAPLLVHVNKKADQAGNSRYELKTEKAIRENWPTMKNGWKSGEIKCPEGLIFVEQLLDEDENGSSPGEGGQNLPEDAGGNETGEGVTRAWGIVVQGKGTKCGEPACYLLKTTRVKAGCGLGLFCNHFCLTKVTDYGGNTFRQLQDFWLLP